MQRQARTLTRKRGERAERDFRFSVCRSIIDQVVLLRPVVIVVMLSLLNLRTPPPPGRTPLFDPLQNLYGEWVQSLAAVISGMV